MSETLGALITSVRNLLSETATDYFDDTAMTDHVNRAMKMVYADAPWIFPAAYGTSTVPGCPTYLLPTRLVIPSGTYMRTTGGVWYRLNFWPPAIIDQYRQYAAKRPSQNLYMCTYRVTELGTTVDLLYEPSARMQMRVFGYQVPQTLTSLSDLTDVPEWGSHVVVARAVMAAKFMDEENTEFQLAKAEYTELVRDLRARRSKRQMDQLNITRPMRGFSRGRFPWIG